MCNVFGVDLKREREAHLAQLLEGGKGELHGMENPTATKPTTARGGG